jgi:hypothetical protein
MTGISGANEICRTGPLYAAVDPDDAYHERSQGELRRVARDRRDVIVAYPTLLETYTLVLHRLGEPVASKWLTDILSGTAGGQRMVTKQG